MSKKIPIILIRSLDTVRGGITKASITRANVLAENFKKVIIITTLFQQNHQKVINDLKTKKILSEKVVVLNFFEDIKHKKKNFLSFLKGKEHLNIFEKNLTAIPVKNLTKGKAYRYYKNGLYIKYKRFTENNELLFIDYMNKSRHRLKREEYNLDGFLMRIRHMDNKLNKPRLDRYFDIAGNCYMTVWIDPKTGNEKNAITFQNQPKQYTNLMDLKIEWLQNTLKTIKEPVVMTEQRSLDKLIWKVSHNNIKKIGVVHANHLEESDINVNNPLKSYSTLFDNAHKYDNIVVLTKEQKQDIIKVHKLKNLKVIPHLYQHKDYNKIKRDYNRHLAVTLARFHKDKQLNESIQAFRYVVDKIPFAEYHIYGYGPEKEKLIKLINNLNLNKNVFLKEYTFKSAEVYQTAACSILTSKREGFGMVITESMAMGTPVVSYNTKYGPNDIIKDGINGYIVPFKDRKLLAEKILKIMIDDKNLKFLSKNALEIRKTFSKKKFINNWVEIINSK